MGAVSIVLVVSVLMCSQSAQSVAQSYSEYFVQSCFDVGLEKLIDILR